MGWSRLEGWPVFTASRAHAGYVRMPKSLHCVILSALKRPHSCSGSMAPKADMFMQTLTWLGCIVGPHSNVYCNPSCSKIGCSVFCTTSSLVLQKLLQCSCQITLNAPKHAPLFAFTFSSSFNLFSHLPTFPQHSLVLSPFFDLSLYPNVYSSQVENPKWPPWCIWGLF